MGGADLQQEASQDALDLLVAEENFKRLRGADLNLRAALRYESETLSPSASMVGSQMFVGPRNGVPAKPSRSDLIHYVDDLRKFQEVGGARLQINSEFRTDVRAADSSHPFLLFWHLPGTGGTQVRETLRKSGLRDCGMFNDANTLRLLMYRADICQTEEHEGPPLKSPHCLEAHCPHIDEMKRHLSRGCDFIAGHLRFGLLSRIISMLNQYISRPVVTFLMVRHPVDRLVTEYRRQLTANAHASLLGLVNGSAPLPRVHLCNESIRPSVHQLLLSEMHADHGWRIVAAMDPEWNGSSTIEDRLAYFDAGPSSIRAAQALRGISVVGSLEQRGLSMCVLYHFLGLFDVFQERCVPNPVEWEQEQDRSTHEAKIVTDDRDTIPLHERLASGIDARIILQNYDNMRSIFVTDLFQSELALYYLALRQMEEGVAEVARAWGFEGVSWQTI